MYHRDRPSYPLDNLYDIYYQSSAACTVPYLRGPPRLPIPSSCTAVVAVSDAPDLSPGHMIRTTTTGPTLTPIECVVSLCDLS